MNVDEAYKTLSDLIFKGFLMADMDLDRKHFILKTVNEREFDLIKMYSGQPDRTDYLIRFNIYFLIFSVFMIDNKNILSERTAVMSELFDLFGSLPNSLTIKISSHLQDLRKNSYESLKFLEGFSYTGVSRNSWRSLRGTLPTSVEFTGIPGTSELGLNVHQESWLLMNQAMDSEDDYNQRFSLALMISSATNPKGTRHIRNQHDSRMKSVEDRRIKLAKEGFIDTKKWSSDGWAAPVDTAEELVAELERQMSGKKDRHDLAMEQYMKNMRDQAEAKTQAVKDQVAKAQADHDNVFIEGSTRTLTPQEAKELMSRKVSTLAKTKSEEYAGPEDQDKFLKKVGSRVLTGK